MPGPICLNLADNWTTLNQKATVLLHFSHSTQFSSRISSKNKAKPPFVCSYSRPIQSMNKLFSLQELIRQSPAFKGLKLQLGFPQGSGVPLVGGSPSAQIKLRFSQVGGSPSAQIKLRFSQDQDHRQQISRLTRMTDMYCRSCQDCRVPRRSLGVRRGYVGVIWWASWESMEVSGGIWGPCWV